MREGGGGGERWRRGRETGGEVERGGRTLSWSRGSSAPWSRGAAPRSRPTCPLLSEEGTPLKVQGLFPASQGQNLALTVLYVPGSLDGGGRCRGCLYGRQYVGRDIGWSYGYPNRFQVDIQRARVDVAVIALRHNASPYLV